jgi:glycosyltransferase involved in cell wall biosynthesis
MMGMAESQIMKNWEHQDSPLVSIVCATYNHECYIGDAIEILLKQETIFSFEIIIHDDASTDKTVEIIENYAKQYPTIIKPIYQKENQLSQYIARIFFQNKSSLHETNFFTDAIACAKGEYIAFCEGDDYWTEPKKLQIQIDEMKKHPECNMSFHPGIYRWVNGSKPDKIVSQYSSFNKVFTPSEIILGGGEFCLTSSLMVKKKVFEVLPKWFHEVLAGDYFIQMLSALEGGALYINKIMSVNRAYAPGSWSEKIANNEDYFYNFYSLLIKSLEHMNVHTNLEYENEFNYLKRRICIYMCRSLVLSVKNRKKAFAQYENILNYKDKMMWYLVYRSKRLCKLAYSLRNSVLNYSNK